MIAARSDRIARWEELRVRDCVHSRMCSELVLSRTTQARLCSHSLYRTVTESRLVISIEERAL